LISFKDKISFMKKDLVLLPTEVNEAVKRNKERFPSDFMFQLNRK